MFIVFEGIDGSGKTTLSGRVAEELKETGISVHQARPKGELKSRLASRIRTLARDPRNLNMSPHTELFLYIARDTQMIDTVIRPSLDAAEVVIADRYLFSPVVLCRARGAVDPAEVDRAVGVAARGLWPDLVVYCDVDIDTSYMRKRVDKIENPRAPDDFGRKGLRGLGLRAAMRREYLAMAKSDPERWFQVDNARGSIEENTAAIANRILLALGRSRKSEPCVDDSVPPSIAPGPEPAKQGAEVSELFYNYTRELAENGGARAAAYHLRSIESDEAWEQRELLLPQATEIVVYGITPLSSQRALEMRWRTVEQVPGRVARSLNAFWADEHEEAWKLRDKLASKVPLEVGLTLGALDSSQAWEMRDRLADAAPGVILSSLKGINTPRAWELRGKYGRKNKWVWGLLEGLAYLDDERSWELRDAHRKQAMPWVILSTLGCNSTKAWDLRRTHLSQATKLVMRSLAGSVDPEAWTMRKQAGPWAKETLTTIKNMDTEEAWKLRRELMDVWPVFAAKSVGLTLAGTERGYQFLWELVEKRPNDPEVVHYAVKAYEVHHRN